MDLAYIHSPGLIHGDAHRRIPNPLTTSSGEPVVVTEYDFFLHGSLLERSCYRPDTVVNIRATGRTNGCCDGRTITVHRLAPR
jgi:hypothetical protein